MEVALDGHEFLLKLAQLRLIFAPGVCSKDWRFGALRDNYEFPYNVDNCFQGRTSTTDELRDTVLLSMPVRILLTVVYHRTHLVKNQLKVGNLLSFLAWDPCLDRCTESTISDTLANRVGECDAYLIIESVPTPRKLVCESAEVVKGTAHRGRQASHG